MQYLLRNDRYGHEKVAPSEACRDNILKGKLDKDGNRITEWYVVKELPEPEPVREMTTEEKRAMLLAQLEELGGVSEAGEVDAKPAPKKKAAKRAN